MLELFPDVAAARRPSLTRGLAVLAVALGAAALPAPALAAPQAVGYSITFESNDGAADGWARSGLNATLWQHGTPTNGPTSAHSGTKCFGTDLTADYPPDAEAFLETPVLNLAGATAPRITFHHHMDSESSFDGGSIQVKRGTAAYVTIQASDPGFLMGAPNTTSIAGTGGAGWSGNPTGTGFQPVIIDLFSLTTPGLSGITASEQIQLRFYFGSDSSIEGPGWFIDTFAFANGGAIPVVTFTADTTGAPTWNRPDSSGSALATSATRTPFQMQPFIVPPGGTGAYTITADWTGFDGFLFLYRFPFDPAQPLRNFIAGNDDYQGIARSRLAGQNLDAEQRYVVVMTGYGNSDDGPYSIRIEGPERVRFLPGGVVFRASFEGTPVVGDWPLPVRFTDLSSGGASEWLWDFGDGATSTEQNPVHIYRGEGRYDVSLTIKDGAREDTLRLEEYVMVSRPSGPPRKHVEGRNGMCAAAAGAATPAGAFGLWAPLALAILGAAAAARRRGGPGPERPA
jgi:hypothetical protein